MQQMKNRFRGETAKYIRIVLLVIYDILAIFLAEILSIWTRFDFSLKSEQGNSFFRDSTAIFLGKYDCNHRDIFYYASVQ